MSIYFDGTDDYCYNDNDLGNIDVTTITTACWVYTSSDSTQTGYVTGLRYNADTRWWVRFISGRIPYFVYIFDGSLGQWKSDDGAIASGQWVHVMWVFDRSSSANNPKCYIDGVAVSSVVEVTTPSGNARTGQDSIRFGEHLNGTEDFNGYLAEVAIWSGDKSGIASDLAGGDLPSEHSDNLLQYWRMLSGDPFASEQNSGYDLTNSGAEGDANHPVAAGTTTTTAVPQIMHHWMNMSRT